MPRQLSLEPWRALRRPLVPSCYRFCYPIPWYGAERDGTAAWLWVRFRPEHIDQVARGDMGRYGQSWSIRWSRRTILPPATPASFSTVISWFRSWGSYFCGSSGEQWQDRKEGSSPSEWQNPFPRALPRPLFDARTNREHRADCRLGFHACGKGRWRGAG